MTLMRGARFSSIRPTSWRSRKLRSDSRRQARQAKGKQGSKRTSAQDQLRGAARASRMDRAVRRCRGLGLPVLRRRAGPDRRGWRRAPQCFSHHLSRAGSCESAVVQDPARSRSVRWHPHRGADRVGAGLQVCRSPAALSAGADLGASARCKNRCHCWCADRPISDLCGSKKHSGQCQC